MDGEGGGRLRGGFALSRLVGGFEGPRKVAATTRRTTRLAAPKGEEKNADMDFFFSPDSVNTRANDNYSLLLYFLSVWNFGKKV